MFHWFSQVLSVVGFSLLTVPNRLGSSITAAVGIAGVVAVLVGVLAIGEGFRKTLTIASSADVAVVLRTGADNEMTSGISRDEARLLRDVPGVARDEAGALTSAELFVVINLPKRATGTDANVPMRGIEWPAFKVRDDVQIVEGRRFELGKSEIIVGAGAARAFSGLEVGKEIRVGQINWKITGIFTANGGASESEIWCDASVLMPAYQRDGYQSVYARLTSEAAFQEFKDAVTTNAQLNNLKVMTLRDFHAEQTQIFTDFITKIGVFIAGMMALGALFGALNTMYGAVSARTREIATLRALGFGSWPVIISVLIESLTIALAGGAVGAIGAYLAFDGYKTQTLNWQTFSQVTFAFAVTPTLLKSALIWAAVLGLVGGLFPAIRAARQPIASALRET